ncbi:MAG: GntR family transcriptional regulator [Armatimonadota bacterium]|nr:GntR family transcriptional regulator [Armatimonadota bacterium]
MPRQSLPRYVAEMLRNEIVAGRFAGADVLPSETELARAFEISRPTLREALRVLEHEGWLTRRHGVGSFVNRPVTAGLERLESFTEAIRRTGEQATDQVLEICERPIDASGASTLGVRPGAPGILVRSLRRARGHPVLYCEDLLPGHLVGSVEMVQRRRERESLLDFLRLDLRIDVAEATLWLTACAASPRVARLLEVPVRKPLLRLAGIARDRNQTPLYRTTNYVCTDRYVFTVVRR